LIDDVPLLDAFSAQAVCTIHEFEPLSLANSAWAFAKIERHDVPLLHSIASEALPMLS